MEKTVIFEKKYNTNIEKFSTTKDINECIERKIGRELEVININDHGLATKRGSVFKVGKYDIDHIVDEALEL